MLKLEQLVVGQEYVHVDGFDGRRTRFRYQGNTGAFKHGITVLERSQYGVESFLVPEDKIINI